MVACVLPSKCGSVGSRSGAAAGCSAPPSVTDAVAWGGVLSRLLAGLAAGDATSTSAGAAVSAGSVSVGAWATAAGVGLVATVVGPVTTEG